MDRNRSGGFFFFFWVTRRGKPRLNYTRVEKDCFQGFRYRGRVMNRDFSIED